MSNPSLDAFMRDILNLQVRDFGGAGAGIAGISSSGDVLLRDLKQSVAEFAREQAKPNADSAILLDLGEKIKAQLRTLQVTNIISAGEADRLSDQLQNML